jgi:molecular chaperone IbpA
MAMRTFDFSPLYRSTVGFDSVTRLLESALRADEGQSSYPPYNIEKTGENDITITAQDNSLVVTGKLEKTEEDKKFLHRGIAGRAFERRFELAEHIRVSGASLVNGLLHVELVKEVPEAKKPRTVKIESVAPKQATVLENQAA